MTVPTGEYATDNYEEIDEDSAYDPVLVEVAGTVQRQNAPDFGGCSLFTAPVAGTGVPVQILNRRPTREQAYVRNNDGANSIIIAERLDKLQQGTPIGYTIGPGGTQKIESQQPYYAVAANIAGASPASFAATGAVAVVGAGQVIVSEVIPAGTYVVNWNLVLGGVPTVADDDNCQLMLGATVIEIAVNGSTVSAAYPQTPVTVVVPTGGGTLQVQSIAAGSAAATYRVQLVATPTSGSGSTPAPVSVSVLDEAWLVLDNAHPERGYRGKD